MKIHKTTLPSVFLFASIIFTSQPSFAVLKEKIAALTQNPIESLRKQYRDITFGNIAQLRAFLGTYRSKLNSMPIEDQVDLYNLTKLTIAQAIYFKQAMYLQDVVLEEYDQKTEFAIRLPGILYAKQIDEVITNRILKYENAEAFKVDLQKISELLLEINSKKIQTTTKVNAEQFVGETKALIAIQHQMIIRMYAAREDIRKKSTQGTSQNSTPTLEKLRQGSLAHCFRNNSVNSVAAKRFASFFDQNRFGPKLEPREYSKNMDAAARSLEQAALNYYKSPSPENFVRYEDSYHAILNEPMFAIDTSTITFKTWLGPLKSPQKLQEDGGHHFVVQDLLNTKSMDALRDVIKERHMKDAMSVVTKIQAESFVQEMSLACEKIIKASSLVDLLDWPVALALKLEKHPQAVTWLPVAIEKRFKEIRTKKRINTAVQVTGYAAALFLVAAGGASWLAPEFVAGSTVLRVAMTFAPWVLTAVSLADLGGAYYLRSTYRSREDRVHTAMIAGFSDEKQREETMEIYAEIKMLTNYLWIAGVTTAAADSVYIVRGFFRLAGNGSKFMMDQLVSWRNQLRNYRQPAKVAMNNIDQPVEAVIKPGPRISHTVFPDDVSTSSVTPRYVDDVAEVMPSPLSGEELLRQRRAKAFAEMNSWEHQLNEETDQLLEKMNPQSVLGNRAQAPLNNIDNFYVTEPQAYIEAGMGDPKVELIKHISRTNEKAHIWETGAFLLQKMGFLRNQEISALKPLTNIPKNPIILDVNPVIQNQLGEPLAKELGGTNYIVTMAPHDVATMTIPNRKILARQVEDGHVVLGLESDIPMKGGVDYVLFSRPLYPTYFNQPAFLSFKKVISELCRVVKKNGYVTINAGVKKAEAKNLAEYLDELDGYSYEWVEEYIRIKRLK